jgi:ketosteroid isomerase-like protein
LRAEPGSRFEVAAVRSVYERATELLHAFAHSDLAAIERLCADNVLVWGTDAPEVWQGKAALLAAFAGAYDLGVSWSADPTVGDDWVAGRVLFTLPTGEQLPARVTMVFRDGLLAHAHYSAPSGIEGAAE